MASKPKLIDELPDRMLTTADVMELVNISRAELYIAMGERGFPHPIKIHKTRNAWLFSEVMAWIKAQPRASGFKGRAKRKNGRSIADVRRAQLAKEHATA